MGKGERRQMITLLFNFILIRAIRSFFTQTYPLYKVILQDISLALAIKVIFFIITIITKG